MVHIDDLKKQVSEATRPCSGFMKWKWDDVLTPCRHSSEGSNPQLPCSNDCIDGRVFLLPRALFETHESKSTYYKALVDAILRIKPPIIMLEFCNMAAQEWCNNRVHNGKTIELAIWTTLQYFIDAISRKETEE